MLKSEIILQKIHLTQIKNWISAT